MAAAIAGMHRQQMQRSSAQGRSEAAAPTVEYAPAGDESAKDGVDKISLRRRALAKLVVDIGDTFLRDLEAEIQRASSGWKASKTITYTRDKKLETVRDGAAPDTAYDCDSQYEGGATPLTFFLSLPAIKYKITVATNSETLFSVFINPSEGHDFGNNAMTRTMKLKWTYNKNSSLEETIERALSSTVLEFASLLAKPQPQPTLAAPICSVNAISSVVRMRIDKTTPNAAWFAILSTESNVAITGTLWGTTIVTRLLEGVLTITEDRATTVRTTEHEKDYYSSPVLAERQFASVADFLTWWSSPTRTKPVKSATTPTLHATLQRLANALLDNTTMHC